MTPFVVTVLCAAGLAAALAYLFWRLASPAPQLSFTPDWWEHFSTERYRPLRHLLAEDDFAFLRRQAGFVPAMERELRRRRMQICRTYLREIREDFLRLQGLGQALVAAGQAEPSLQNSLFEQRVRFTRSWWTVRVRLEMYRFGLAGADFSGLIGTMKTAADQLQPALMPAA